MTNKFAKKILGYCKGITFCFLWYTSICAGFFVFYCPALLLLLLSNSWYRWYTDLVFSLWEFYPTALLELCYKTKIYTYGSPFRKKDSGSLFLMNHRTRLDWNYAWLGLHALETDDREMETDERINNSEYRKNSYDFMISKFDKQEGDKDLVNIFSSNKNLANSYEVLEVSEERQQHSDLKEDYLEILSDTNCLTIGQNHDDKASLKQCDKIISSQIESSELVNNENDENCQNCENNGIILNDYSTTNSDPLSFNKKPGLRYRKTLTNKYKKTNFSKNDLNKQLEINYDLNNSIYNSFVTYFKDFLSTSHNMKYVLKDEIKHLPGPGWVMQMCSFPYIKRNWSHDRDQLIETVKYLSQISGAKITSLENDILEKLRHDGEEYETKYRPTSKDETNLGNKLVVVEENKENFKSRSQNKNVSRIHKKSPKRTQLTYQDKILLLKLEKALFRENSKKETFLVNAKKALRSYRNINHKYRQILKLKLMLLKACKKLKFHTFLEFCSRSKNHGTPIKCIKKYLQRSNYKTLYDRHENLLAKIYKTNIKNCNTKKVLNMHFQKALQYRLQNDLHHDSDPSKSLNLPESNIKAPSMSKTVSKNKSGAIKKLHIKTKPIKFPVISKNNIKRNEYIYNNWSLNNLLTRARKYNNIYTRSKESRKLNRKKKVDKSRSASNSDDCDVENDRNIDNIGNAQRCDINAQRKECNILRSLDNLNLTSNKERSTEGGQHVDAKQLKKCKRIRQMLLKSEMTSDDINKYCCIKEKIYMENQQIEPLKNNATLLPALKPKISINKVMKYNNVKDHNLNIIKYQKIGKWINKKSTIPKNKIKHVFRQTKLYCHKIGLSKCNNSSLAGFDNIVYQTFTEKLTNLANSFAKVNIAGSPSKKEVVEQQVCKIDDMDLKKNIDTFLDSSARRPYQLLIFPEGTDLSKNTLKKAHDYARSKNKPLYNYVLHPRPRGFCLLVRAMKACHSLDSVYDITVAYRKTVAQNEIDALKGHFPEEVHFLFRRYSGSYLNSLSDVELRQWLESKWSEKELILQKFHETGTFPYRKLKRTISKLKLTLALLFWTILVFTHMYLLYSNALHWRWWCLFHSCLMISIRGFNQLEIRWYKLKNWVFRKWQRFKIV